MAHYIVTGSYTAQAMKGMIASPSDREAAVRPLIEAAGGKLKTMLITTGETDFLMIVESPAMDHGLMAALMVAGASGSACNLKTVQAFTSEEFLAAQHEAGRIAAGYRPAG
jgi:uncharacterized protein with GYD domain